MIGEIAGLKPTPKNVLLVGHEPYLSNLISRLVSGTGNIAMDFKKGGLCKIEMEKLRDGTSTRLVWLLTPKLMKEMA
jgi:phosphohistidine phosphatase